MESQIDKSRLKIFKAKLLIFKAKSMLGIGGKFYSSSSANAGTWEWQSLHDICRLKN